VLGDATVLEDLGEHRLRDLDRPIRVFQAGVGTFASLRSLDSLPGNLPLMPSSFVGRQEELASVAKELGECRLVTLTGVGGVGKTRLALQVAAELLPGFADGAWLCELAAAANAEELAQVVAIALGVAQRRQMSMAESIVDFLRPRQLLLVLDNCEHLLDAAADLAGAILGGAPGVRILATSREGFGMPGERMWPLRSLSVGDGADVESSEAVLLFVDRARSVTAAFVLDEARTPGVVEVCRRLDGIPLAIELAAARVAVMSPAEIAGHLDERFRLLTGGRRGHVERHQTLRAAVEWSYSLLTDRERTVFDRLGVFPATFDEAAAVVVCGGDGVDRWDVIDAVSSLVAKSMLGADQADEQSRYQLLETLRHFAREHAGDDLERLRRRHAEYYAGFAEHLHEAMFGPEELVWRSRLAAELDNFRAAVGWAFDAPSLDDVALGVRVLSGLVGEALAQTSWGMLAWAEPVLSRLDQLDAPQRAMVLAYAADEAYFLGAFDRAKSLGARAIDESATHGSAAQAAQLAVSLSTLAGGDPAAAMTVLTEGRVRIEALDDPKTFLCSHRSLMSTVAYYGGDYAVAKSEAAHAVALARSVGSPTLLAVALCSHALALSDSDPDIALAAAEESIRLVEAGAGNSVYSTSLQTAATLRWAKGDRAGAAMALRAAVAHEYRIGGSRAVLGTLVALVALLLAGSPETFDAATTLSGAVKGPVFGHIQLYLRPAQRDQYARDLAKASTSLGTDAYASAETRGTGMAYDEIVRFTLDNLARLADIGS